MNAADARHHDLMFLLGLAPLALGCAVGVADDGPTFTSAAPGTPPGDGASASDEDTSATSGQSTIGSPDDGESMSASADGTTSNGSASASASASASMSAGDGVTTYDYTSGGPPPGGTTCEAYGYLLASCYAGGDPAAAAMYAESCEYAIYYYGAVYGPACGLAFEDTRVCISQLSCQQLPMFGAGACDAELAAAMAACA